MPRRVLLASCFLLSSLLAHAQSPRQRHIVFRYAVMVKDVPAGKELRVWIPLAHSDAFQDVQLLSKDGDLKLRQSVDDLAGNASLVAEADTNTVRDYRFEVKYDVVRFERRDLIDGKLSPNVHPQRSSQAFLDGYLKADRLVPITGQLAQVAAEEIKSAATPIDKARTIYEYVRRNVRFDPSGKGCCQGEANQTLDAKHGDSTDLTAVFVAMLRSQGIPARGAIGFALPADKHTGELTPHASWAEFYAAPLGWLVADVTAGIRNPEQQEYYFGSLDMNRLQLSVGRDLKLNPPQESGPLNFLVEPYVEVEGKPYAKVSLDASFRDVGASAAEDPQH